MKYLSSSHLLPQPWPRCSGSIFFLFFCFQAKTHGCSDRSLHLKTADTPQPRSRWRLGSSQEMRNIRMKRERVRRRPRTKNKQQGGTMHGVVAAILPVLPPGLTFQMLHSNQTGITNCTFQMQSLPTGKFGRIACKRIYTCLLHREKPDVCACQTACLFWVWHSRNKRKHEAFYSPLKQTEPGLIRANLMLSQQVNLSIIHQNSAPQMCYQTSTT